MKENVTKPKTIRYKKVILKGQKTLQDYIKEVILTPESTFYKVANRKQFVSTTSDDTLFINHISEYKNMVYGELVVIEMGKSQQFIEIDDDASEYNIKALSSVHITTDEDNKKTQKLRREFVESVLYFGAIGNHLAVIQSRALTAKTLESYLDWLLGEASDAMQDDYAVVLKDTPNLEVQEKLDKTPAKTLVIGTEVTAEEIQESTVIATSKFNLSYHIVNVFKAFLQEDFSTLKLEDDLEDANLRLKLEMTYDRKTNTSGQKVIDSVVASLRHHDDYKIVLEDGSTVTSDDFKLSGKVSMQIIKGNVYTSGLKSEIHSWLIENVDFSE